MTNEGEHKEMILKEHDYCEIVIRYTRKMPPTSLHFLKLNIEHCVRGYKPKLVVRTEEVKDE